MKDHNVAFDIGQVFNSFLRNRLAAYESGHRTWSGTAGVITCNYMLAVLPTA